MNRILPPTRDFNPSPTQIPIHFILRTYHCRSCWKRDYLLLQARWCGLLDFVHGPDRDACRREDVSTDTQHSGNIEGSDCPRRR